MSSTEARERRSGLQLSPTGLTTFLVVDAILVMTFLVLLVLHVVNSAGASPGGGSAPVAASPTASAVPETTPEASAPSSPAANQGVAEFVLPSGNIWCSMTETSATCTIGQYSFTPPEPPPGCEGVVGPVFTVTAEEGASVPCVPEVPPRPAEAPTLEYGQATTVGEMTCFSSRNGATCRHDPTGEGFSVARAGYTTL